MKTRLGLVVAFIWAFFLLFGLGFLFFSTNQKSNTYSTNPPFRREAPGNPLGLLSLFDSDLKTFWTKNQENGLEWDLVLELGLSHIWDGLTFSPISFKTISIDFCSPILSKTIHYGVFLREAINVDQELRMPKDTDIFHGDQIHEVTTILIPLDEKIKLIKEEKYPNGISIVGMRLKVPTGTCISEIKLNE